MTFPLNIRVKSQKYLWQWLLCASCSCTVCVCVCCVSFKNPGYDETLASGSTLFISYHLELSHEADRDLESADASVRLWPGSELSTGSWGSADSNNDNTRCWLSVNAGGERVARPAQPQIKKTMCASFLTVYKYALIIQGRAQMLTLSHARLHTLNTFTATVCVHTFTPWMQLGLLQQHCLPEEHVYILLICDIISQWQQQSVQFKLHL